MTHRTSTYLLGLVAALVCALASVVASAQPSQSPRDPRDAPADTTRRDTTQRDTGIATGAGDSIRVGTRTASGADTAVSYSSRDSMKLSISGKIMRLYGDAEVVKGSMRLTAGYIEIDFRTSELTARAVYDSATGEYVGIPVFKDATQEFSALSMRYNFRTGKGITEAAETKFDDGFYRGEKIKRVDAVTLFIQDGVYTTCDAPHPHYFFRSEKMKVVLNDKIYVEQPTLHVSNVPIFFIPIGVFFARSGGKQSGLIIPTWSQNSARGFTLQDLGYFWAGNEYVDALVLTDLYSKGGYTLKPFVRFRHREWGIDASDLRYVFGRTRDDPDEELETSHQVMYNHQQKLWRRATLGGNLDFSTRNARRNTSTSTDRFNRTDDITMQLLRSNFSFNQGFDWGSLVAQYDRTQNIITDELTQRLPVSLQLTSWTPFQSVGTDPSIFSNLSVSWNERFVWEEVRADTLPGGGFAINDTRRGLQHSPSINLALPRIGYFSVVPRIDVQGATFFRRTIRELVDDTVRQRTVPQMTTTLSWGAAVDVSTTLYGILEPRIFGVNAIRHAVRPRITYEYRPDIGRRYYDSVYNPAWGRYERYSMFAADASVAPVPGIGLTNRIGFTLENQFEAKVAQGDTLPDRNVSLGTLTASGSYNAASEDFKWSVISVTANTQLGAFGSLSASMTLDPYGLDTAGVRVPVLLNDRGLGLVRITSGGLRFGMSFSDQGFGSTVAPTVPRSDSVGARRQRFDFESIPFEEEQFFGDEVRGAGEYRIPWTINIDGAYQVSRGIGRQADELVKNASLTVGFNLGLTPTTRITSSVTYDLIQKEIVIPTIGFYKDLHCWEMQFDWRPSGFGSGFYFRLGIKSPQLRDIELEREATYFE